MEVGSLAASAVATSAQQTRDGFTVASLKIGLEQQELIAGLVGQTAEAAKAATADGVGALLDKTA